MTCPVCGCDFKKHHHKQKFCSEKCSVINHRRQVRVELVEAMKAKYATIDIDKEIDKWIGGINGA